MIKSTQVPEVNRKSWDDASESEYDYENELEKVFLDQSTQSDNQMSTTDSTTTKSTLIDHHESLVPR